jgi:hypothetical protein
MESISEALARSFGVDEIYRVPAEEYDYWLSKWVRVTNGHAIVCGMFQFLEENQDELLGFDETWFIANIVDPGSNGYNKKGAFDLDNWAFNEMAAKSSLVSGYGFQYDEAAVRIICMTLFRWRRRLEHRWEQEGLRRIIENIRIRAGHYPNRPTEFPRFPGG